MFLFASCKSLAMSSVVFCSPVLWAAGGCSLSSTSGLQAAAAVGGARQYCQGTQIIFRYRKRPYPQEKKETSWCDLYYLGFFYPNLKTDGTHNIPNSVRVSNSDKEFKDHLGLQNMRHL